MILIVLYIYILHIFLFLLPFIFQFVLFQSHKGCASAWFKITLLAKKKKEFVRSPLAELSLKGGGCGPAHRKQGARILEIRKWRAYRHISVNIKELKAVVSSTRSLAKTRAKDSFDTGQSTCLQLLKNGGGEGKSPLQFITILRRLLE